MDARVVVTGIGVVTPIGSGRQAFWRHLLAGRCGVAPVESFDTSGYKVHVGCEVKDFDPAPYVERLEAERLGRASQLAIAAARLALADAERAAEDLEPARCGVAMGTTSGEPREVERFDDCYVAERLEQVDDRFMSLYPCHVIAGHVAAELGFAGPNLVIPAACAAGNYAIANALDVLRAGRAELMLAGGADCFSRITYTGFARLGAIAPERCQPFDKNRRGMIPGEGAAVLVLEPLARALARGAPVYAEVRGYGLSCDAHHMTAAHPDGAARAMARALEESGAGADEVAYVSAHGTGTPTNDRLETRALERIFGDRARRLPTSSIKSMIGHTMGAASAIEGAVCALAVHDDHVPPTIHFERPDPECEVDCVPNEARAMKVPVAMNNAYAFGGNNASVIFRKVPEARP
ncbi:MAG: beta-ketoacyl-[acyl-carrier-protein] synthase family protein [Acidobacteria bacterium]|nr:MAG: beta-ketoacyl-[acyl-carrier-protein] synthase family protein [Acidobacteriota bacterium]